MADTQGRGGNFLGRWSERKVQARQADLPVNAPVKPAEPIKPVELASPDADAPHAPDGQPLATAGAELQPGSPARSPQPTLEDVAKLTADSDYSTFAARHVEPRVRNAAMRKLFAGDPHFNVMDGLDVYIDDYSVGVPIPQSMMRQMVQARSLGLLDDELVEQDLPSSPELPSDLAANDNESPHENTDLQLQRNDAAGHSSAADRTESAEERQAASSPDFDIKPDAADGDTACRRPV